MDALDLDQSAAGLAELAQMLAGLPPLGRWVADALCASLSGAEADVFTVTTPLTAAHEAERAAARAVCSGCAVRRECAAYAESAPVFGMWAGRWYGEKELLRVEASRRRVARQQAA